MGLVAKIKAYIQNLKQKRRTVRKSYAFDVMYFSENKGMYSGRAQVINVNKGGICLDLDTLVEPETQLAVRINPHVVLQHIDLDRVMKDDRGRAVMKIVWVRPKEEGKGCFIGGFFLTPENQPYR